MVAHGSAGFHAARNALDLAAGPQARVGDRDRQRGVSAPAVLIGALALWFHYGTAVFFEMIASGISACF